MKMSRTLRTALRALGRNKTRALLTTLGIIIGVGAVIAMMEIGRGSSSSIQRTIASMGANNLSIQPDGTISAVFSNGKTTNVAQIILAQFSNVNGLLGQGGGLYSESPASGASFLGVPGQGGRGLLTSGALEASNVDLASELTKIITFQRGYQANAKIITMTDQIMQDTLNLKQ